MFVVQLIMGYKYMSHLLLNLLPIRMLTGLVIQSPFDLLLDIVFFFLWITCFPDMLNAKLGYPALVLRLDTGLLLLLHGCVVFYVSFMHLLLLIL